MWDDHGFRVTDILSRVGSDLGPVLIFGSAQTAPRQEVKQHLAGKTVVRVTNPSDSTEMWSDLLELRNLFASGEPFLPRRLVVAILIVRKLYRHNYWGGSHQKNFIRGDEIANGRGVDSAFKDIAQDVANFLQEVRRREMGRRPMLCVIVPERLRRSADEGAPRRRAKQIARFGLEGPPGPPQSPNSSLRREFLCRSTAAASARRDRNTLSTRTV